MQDEYRFQLIIAPETYDYGEEEITYRIYFDEQLISERSMPILHPNQAITDNFILKLEKNIDVNLIFENISNKKAEVKKVVVNDFSFDKFIERIQFKGLTLSLNRL